MGLLESSSRYGQSVVTLATLNSRKGCFSRENIFKRVRESLDLMGIKSCRGF